MNATKLDLVGRTIVAIDFRPFSDGRGGGATAPKITLDNGRALWFTTQETDVGDYGTAICIDKGVPES